MKLFEEKPMSFRCDYCRTPVAPGERVCLHKRCRQREAERQTNVKCREFGLEPYYKEPRPFPRQRAP